MTPTPDPRSAKEIDEYGPLPADQATCDHHWVQTWSGNLAGRLWACGDCKLRFYPACLVCVDVGHRNVDHPALAQPAPLLDVAALDAAMAANGTHVDLRRDHPRPVGCASCKKALVAIAREYAALSEPKS